MHCNNCGAFMVKGQTICSNCDADNFDYTFINNIKYNEINKEIINEQDSLPNKNDKNIVKEENLSYDYEIKQKNKIDNINDKKDKSIINFILKFLFIIIFIFLIAFIIYNLLLNKNYNNNSIINNSNKEIKEIYNNIINDINIKKNLNQEIICYNNCSDLYDIGVNYNLSIYDKEDFFEIELESKKKAKINCDDLDNIKCENNKMIGRYYK